MIIQLFYDKGTSNEQEDGYFASMPFLGVVDATSAPYSPSHPAIRFEHGLTGGEMARNIVSEVFYEVRPVVSLERVALLANSQIALFQEKSGLSLEDAGQLAGASFVFTKFEGDRLHLLLGGDCIAVWEYHDSSIRATTSRVQKHEAEARAVIAKLMEKHQGNRPAMWDEFYPILCGLRRRNYNNRNSDAGFAMLNGQREVEECWEKIVLAPKVLKTLLLCSDGLVGTSRPEDMISLYHKAGLPGILAEVRAQENRDRKKSHIDHAEATGVAVTF